ncbi:hypothetical protein CDD80_6530 [Ophiocordyceps camponoti-rufipedis]|uniref:Uncharacterized protein n=1 Tax=Ophiocordyceps camponoti-rufipedis TaxID=2004952 RepID=A0A2C5YQ45_9HYPO|nr:hypothetical protein CDD80_6530 [Ophiocordyceps camponoti-rufipedis]
MIKASFPPRPWDQVLTPCIRVVSQRSDHQPSFPQTPPPDPIINWQAFPPRISSSVDANGRPRTATSVHSLSTSNRNSNISTGRVPRHHKSVAHFPPAPPPRSVPEPEPQSVFESDSDDSDDDQHARSFFRFHRRNDSDGRRSTKPPPSAAPDLPPSKSRPRTAPSLADITKQEPQRRKRQGHDVFGRMLGRRSR